MRVFHFVVVFSLILAITASSSLVNAQETCKIEIGDIHYADEGWNLKVHIKGENLSVNISKIELKLEGQKNINLTCKNVIINGAKFQCNNINKNISIPSSYIYIIANLSGSLTENSWNAKFAIKITCSIYNKTINRTQDVSFSGTDTLERFKLIDIKFSITPSDGARRNITIGIYTVGGRDLRKNKPISVNVTIPNAEKYLINENKVSKSGKDWIIGINLNETRNMTVLINKTSYRAGEEITLSVKYAGVEYRSKTKLTGEISRSGPPPDVEHLLPYYIYVKDITFKDHSLTKEEKEKINITLRVGDNNYNLRIGERIPLVREMFWPIGLCNLTVNYSSKEPLRFEDGYYYVEGSKSEGQILGGLGTISIASFSIPISLYIRNRRRSAKTVTVRAEEPIPEHIDVG